jgi:SAM-dependent methyltransferase
MTDGTRGPWSSGSAYERYIGRWSRRVAPIFLDWLAVDAGSRWLDVGAGTGALTQAILDCCDPISVIGIDPSEPFVARAREAVEDPRARFVIGDAAATGLEDDAVDAVVSGLVLTFVPDAVSALEEARRVVRRGGTVAGYVWDYAGGMQFIRRFWDAAIEVDPAAAALDQGARFPIAAPGPLAAAFSSAGFDDVATLGIEVPTVFTDFDDYWTPFLGGTGTAPAYVASLSDTQVDAMRERLRTSLPIEPDGSIRLVARAWAARGRRP